MHWKSHCCAPYVFCFWIPMAKCIVLRRFIPHFLLTVRRIRLVIGCREWKGAIWFIYWDTKISFEISSWPPKYLLILKIVLVNISEFFIVLSFRSERNYTVVGLLCICIVSILYLYFITNTMYLYEISCSPDRWEYVLTSAYIKLVLSY